MTPEEYRKQKLEEYYKEHPFKLDEDVKVVQLSRNTKCTVYNMTFEEYLQKTGYKTYEEIKKELGL